MIVPETLPPSFAPFGQFRQWIVWKAVWNRQRNKWDKIPFNPQTGRGASVTNPDDYLSFEQSRDFVRLLGDDYGVGFCFTAQDPFFFVDVDNARQRLGDQWSDWSLLAKQVLGFFPNAIFEVSHSGSGFHLFGGYTQEIVHANKRQDLGLELYVKERFCAMTFLSSSGVHQNLQHVYEWFGPVWFPAPLSSGIADWVDEPVPEWSGPAGDTELIAKMLTSAPGLTAMQGKTATLRQLWERDEDALSRFYPDPEQGRAFDWSSADYALLPKLAWWTGKNSARMDRLFRLSGLMRAKWNDHPSYAERSIGKAIAATDSVLGHGRVTANSGIHGEFTFDLDKITDKAIADQIPMAAAYLTTESEIAVGRDDRLYRYHGGCYHADAERWVGERLVSMLGGQFRKKHVSEAVAWYRTAESKITEMPPLNAINVANGLLDWATLQLRAHSSEYYSTIQTPVRWWPEARCPQVERFLTQILPTESIPLIYEIAGYCLYAGNPMRKAFLFLGHGRNGKSTVLNLIRAILGPKNCSAVSIQTLSENRFAPASLFGKLANIAGDIDARSVNQTDLFKTWTGGDEIYAEHKGGRPFSFKPFATPIFSANEAPLSSDQTEGWFDRWIVLPFDRRLLEAEVDPQLETRLHAESELEGFLVLAVEGLRRLMARGRFELPATVSEAGEGYRLRLDSVLAFVDERCTLDDPEAWISRSQLYGAYRVWCQENGRRPVSNQKMFSHMRTTFDGRIFERKVHGGNRGWLGIRWVPHGIPTV